MPRTPGKSATRQQRADEAFDIYWSMGKSRSLDKLAQDKRTPSIGTLRNYSKAFRWQDRLLTMQEEIADKVDRETALLEAGFIVQQKKFLVAQLQNFHVKNQETMIVGSRAAYLDLSLLLNQLRHQEKDEKPTQIIVMNSIPGK